MIFGTDTAIQNVQIVKTPNAVPRLLLTPIREELTLHSSPFGIIHPRKRLRTTPPQNSQGRMMIRSVGTTMIQTISWLAHISSCWSFASSCLDENDDGNGKQKLSSTWTASTASSSSCSFYCTPSTMVQQRRSKTSSRSSSSSKMKKNQLIKPVSPYEEILPKNKTTDYPFDEVPPKTKYHHLDDEARLDEEVHHQSRQDVAQLNRPASDQRDVPTEIVFLQEGPPSMVSYIARDDDDDDDDDSELSLGHDFKEEARTLTPYPSFENELCQPTADDFHHLYNASPQLEEEQDWPSDEDGPLDKPRGLGFSSEGSAHKRNLGGAKMITKDVDDIPRRNNTRYRLV